MILYLVRHGIAVDVGEKGVRRDSERMLSNEGRVKTEQAARGLHTLQCAPDRVISSPLCRAVETAEIMAAVLCPGATAETCELLSPCSDLDELVFWLRSQASAAVMLVGHMPDLAELAALLLTAELSANILFKKASACCLSFPGTVRSGSGALQWLLQPRQLRLLGTVRPEG